jgi:hypothetical protein
MNPRARYAILKAITIALGALSIPWSTFVGFCFGDGRYFIGVVALCAQTVVSLTDGYIWFWVLENMKGKIQEETGKQHRKDMAKCSESCPLLSENEGGITHPLNELYKR